MCAFTHLFNIKDEIKTSKLNIYIYIYIYIYMRAFTHLFIIKDEIKTSKINIYVSVQTLNEYKKMKLKFQKLVYM